MQRAKRHDGQSELHTGRSQLLLRGAVDEVVLHLDADRCGSKAAVVGDPHRVGDLPGRMVGQCDVAHLPLPHQIVVDRKGLVQRGVGVRKMRVVEIDVVGAQPASAQPVE